jgi:N-formylglutamate amidohydrolase
VPQQFAGTLTVSPQLLWADWYTDELWRFLPALGVSVVTTPLSRFVADPNRDPESGYGNFWSSVVPATDPMGAEVHRRPLRPDEVAARVAAAHGPLHALLDDQLRQTFAVHGRAVLVDLHSFGVPLDTDVIIGDVDGTTASPRVVDAAVRAFSAAGFRVEVNLRFRGGWTVRNAGRSELVDAISVEINQRCYLDSDQVDAWPDVPAMAPARLVATGDRLRLAIIDFVADLSPTPVSRGSSGGQS